MQLMVDADLEVVRRSRPPPVVSYSRPLPCTMRCLITGVTGFVGRIWQRR